MRNFLFKNILIVFFFIVSTLSYAHCASFNKNIKILYQYEGINYHNNPKDPGGATKYGITLRTWKSTVNKYATINTIKSLTKEQAIDFYKLFFWDANNIGLIKDKSFQTALFLAEVNLGPYRPNKIAQHLANSLCDSHLVLDGKLGNNSINAFNKCRMTPGYGYVLFYFYSKTPSIQPVWQWAKKGLRNRVFLSQQHHEG